MILITTAGKVGTEAAGLLAERDIPVRAMVRSPEKATALTAAGVEVVVGDLDDRSTIDAAIDGVTAVILVTAPVPAQELNVIDSATHAGVEHVVKVTSKASADSPILRRRWQTEIEEGLLASALPHTLLRNSVYMQNLLMPAPAIAKSSRFSSSPSRAGRLHRCPRRRGRRRGDRSIAGSARRQDLLADGAGAAHLHRCDSNALAGAQSSDRIQ